MIALCLPFLIDSHVFFLQGRQVGISDILQDVCHELFPGQAPRVCGELVHVSCKSRLTKLGILLVIDSLQKIYTFASDAVYPEDQAVA